MGGGSFSSYLMEHLSRMHYDIEQTTRKLELEQRRLCTLDKNLVSAEGEWNFKRAKYKQQQAVADASVEGKAEAVRTLERNLVKAIEDLNRGNCENEQLREQIDSLRKERTCLDSIFKQMNKDILNNQKLLEQAKQKYSQNKETSEESKHMVRALHKKLERERRQFKDDTRKMREELHNEAEIQKVQDDQNRVGTSKSREVTIGGKKGKHKRTYMVADEEENFSESGMHRKILKLSFLNTIQRRHIRQHQKNIEVFEQAFATIKSSTGISDIEEIVKIFHQLEQRNFSLLTYVNQLNREIESLEIHNRELDDLLKSHNQGQETSDDRKKEAIAELSQQIDKTVKATTEKQAQVEDSSSGLDTSRPLIWKIVSRLNEELPALIAAGYDGDAPPMKVGVPEDMSDNLNNLLMYIEEAILMFRVALSQDVQPQRPQPPKAVAHRPQKPGELPSAHITGDDSDDDPDAGLGERPWTRVELREKAQAMIQRRKRKQHGKLMGEDKRGDAVEEAPAADSAKAGPPPARGEYAASTTVSKDSKESDNAGTPSKNTLQGAKQGDAAAEARDEDSKGDRPENWWRGQGKEEVKKGR